MSIHHPVKKKKTRTKVPLLGKLLALLPLSCALFYPVWLAGQLTLVKTTLYSKSLPEVFSGLTIAYLSDIHYGPYLSQERVRALQEKVNALNADVVILGGDYGKDSQGALDFFALKPHFQAKLCVLGVMGNHDRTVPDSRVLEISKAMRACGITPLVNDAVVLKKQGATLAICAPDDYYNGHPDMKKVMYKVKDADFCIFAPHTPDFLPELSDYFFDLALCGHTHGGQVTLFGRAIKPTCVYGNRYLSGHIKEKGADILISNGVGTSYLPVRLGAKPQYHLIELVCDQT